MQALVLTAQSLELEPLDVRSTSHSREAPKAETPAKDQSHSEGRHRAQRRTREPRVNADTRIDIMHTKVQQLLMPDFISR